MRSAGGGGAVVKLAWHTLDELSGLETHELLRLRESVFVVEQRCAYQEADALDIHARHLIARDDNVMVGYLRVLMPGTARRVPAIGRVLVARSHRGQGLASRLIQNAVRYIETAWPGQPIELSAQRHLTGFYEGHGFEAYGEPYLEDDIPHIAMARLPTGS